MRCDLRRIRTFVTLSLATLVLGAANTWAGDSAVALTKAERFQLWSRNIAVVEQVAPSAKAEPAFDSLLAKLGDVRVAKWLTEHREHLAAHERQKAADYNRYVEQAKGHLQKGEIVEALILANRALTSASDEEALLKSDWVKQLSGTAAAQASKYRQEGKWRKAYEIYYNLTSLFEDNKEFKKARHACLTYARLDAVYDADNKWQEGLEDIVEQNAIDALDHIDRYYVQEADFGAMTESGLEGLLLICDSKVMRKTFPDLNDVDYREQFRQRLQTLVERVRKSTKFAVRDAKSYFRRALDINDKTVRLPEALIIYEFMAAALEPLDDFTSMIWPVEFREFDKHTRGDFVGVGISINGGGSRPINVVSPLEGTPAYRAGILPGDKITHVNGEPLEGVSLTKAVQMITGPIDTEVTLTIKRESDGRVFPVSLKRARIEISSVKGVRRDPEDPQKWIYMLDKEMGIGYVRITSFQANTAGQLRQAVDQVLAAGARSLILDLRFNPGGLLKTAVEVTQLFQERHEKVVSTRGLRDRPWSPPAADHDGPYSSLPLIVLVNQYSASASEIVSGALEDNDRAIILGERTFGKFSVQKLMEVGGSIAHLKLTTARYYLPLGRSLQHEEGATEWGVAPDVEVKLVPKEIIKIRQMQQKRDILARSEDIIQADSQGETDKSSNTADQNVSPTKEGQTKEVAKKTGSEGAIEDKADAVAGADDNEDDEEELNLEPDPNEFPEVDLQLETAVLLMRLHLLSEMGSPLTARADAPLTQEEVQRP